MRGKRFPSFFNFFVQRQRGKKNIRPLESTVVFKKHDWVLRKKPCPLKKRLLCRKKLRDTFFASNDDLPAFWSSTFFLDAVPCEGNKESRYEARRRFFRLSFLRFFLIEEKNESLRAGRL